MTRLLVSRLLALGLLAAALYPALDRRVTGRGLDERLQRLDDQTAQLPPHSGVLRKETVHSLMAGEFSPHPALLVRVAELGPLLTSWQTIGGCGAGSGTGAGAGIKWIGRGVSGGLFNVQTQTTYTRIHSGDKLEHHSLVNTLITRPLSEKWVMGVNVPLVYKYFSDYFYLDPFMPGFDVSNGGLGDISVQLTRKLGRINATSLTALVGVPTGTYDANYRGRLLLQHQQLGFGRVTGTVILDHTMDEIWGVVVVGALGSWRGGQNKFDNYRAPNATTYAYTGYFLGPFVPALGLSATAFKGHDRDQTLEQTTGLFSVAGNVSIEWSTDWVAILAGASFPYQYDGFHQLNGVYRSPWGWGPWMVSLGMALSPF